jgi:hypothetical protein
MSEFAYEKEMQEPVMRWLCAQGFVCTRELCNLNYNPMDIVGGIFGERVSRRIPPLHDCVAVELKLDDIGGVLAQARVNRGCVERSFAAMPADRIARMRSKSIAAFVGDGVGLLAVTVDSVIEILPAQRSYGTHKRIYKNLWRKCQHESKIISQQAAPDLPHTSCLESGE